jgi:peptidoglycan DL-endopeptidase CwlO
VIGERARAAYIHGAPGDELLGMLELPGMTPTNQRLLTFILESDARAVQSAARAFATAEKARRDQENLRSQQLAMLDLLTERRAALEQLTSDIAREIANADPAVREALARLRTEAEAAAGLDWNAFLAAAAGPSAVGLAPSAQAVIAVRTALAQVGDPYVYAATGPDTFDCSGLTVYSYRAAGVSLPRVSRDQYAAGAKVALTALLPGDLLYWATDVTNPRTIHHVGMYVGEGRVVHAPRTGDVVRVVPVWRKGLIGATRPSGAVPGDARAVGLPVPPISPAPVPFVPAQPVAPPPAAAAPTPPAPAAPPPAASPPPTTTAPPPAPDPSQPTTSSPPPAPSPPPPPTTTPTPTPSATTSTPTPTETATTTPAPVSATETSSP